MAITKTMPIHEEEFAALGLNPGAVHYQSSPAELIQQTLFRQEGVLSSTGALCINTGKFTGRSPQDKFTVKDEITENTIAWNNINIPIAEQHFLELKDKMIAYLNQQETIWVRDAYACADENYALNIRVVTETPSSNLFAYNMFLRPTESELEGFKPEWTIIHAPNFLADPAIDGTRQENFSITSFKYKTILIGGTAYTGEMKKGIFYVLNYLMPVKEKVLSMHCSANIGQEKDVAVFFGLSGTGKTTLSADPERKLIGDDEHGWADSSVFNFEGGCYAKCIDLSEEKEPDIFRAIRQGALVENVTFIDDTNEIDFASKKITENTRVSYPINYISNSIEPSIGGVPKNIFFLTCDAYGILPPISKLNAEQAMYQFISGYTAKVAGTETGVTEPKATFSACFGAPFLPLHPGDYARMLGEKLKKHDVNVWLVNTGWIGGGYGVGARIKLHFTRSMIAAALIGDLATVEYTMHPVFGVMVPKSCPGVPSALLDPRSTWTNKEEYDQAAKRLAERFIKNFEKFAGHVDPEVQNAQPLMA